MGNFGGSNNKNIILNPENNGTYTIYQTISHSDISEVKISIGCSSSGLRNPETYNIKELQIRGSINTTGNNDVYYNRSDVTLFVNNRTIPFDTKFYENYVSNIQEIFKLQGPSDISDLYGTFLDFEFKDIEANTVFSTKDKKIYNPSAITIERNLLHTETQINRGNLPHVFVKNGESLKINWNKDEQNKKGVAIILTTNGKIEDNPAHKFPDETATIIKGVDDTGEYVIGQEFFKHIKPGTAFSVKLMRGFAIKGNSLNLSYLIYSTSDDTVEAVYSN